MPSTAGNDEISALVRDFAETPGHLIRRAYQAHTQLWAEVVPVDITGSQYILLCALAVHGDLDQVSVGRVTSLDRSSIAELASRMARRGLIQRGRDERDGRKRVLRITEEGIRTPHRTCTAWASGSSPSSTRRSRRSSWITSAAWATRPTAADRR